MRLLLINNVARYLNGGANRVVVETVEGFHRRGLEVGCIYHSQQSELSPDIWTRKVDSLQSIGNVRPQLLSAISDFRPDIIQSHSAEVVPLYSDWVPHYPSCQYVHDESWHCSGGNRVSRNLVHCQRPHGAACLAWHVVKGCGGRSPVGNFRRWLQVQGRTASLRFRQLRIQVASQFMKRGFLENGYPSDRIDVIPLYSAAPIAAAPTEPGLVVLPSRLVHHKGVRVLIEALNLIKDVPWRLVVPGDGPDKPALEALIQKLGLSGRVSLPGELHPQVVAGWYARAQLVAFPVLREEPYGLVGVEALAYGKPIVAFAGGAVDEWLWPGETGLKVSEKSAFALASALRDLLRDPQRCETMGAAARRRYPQFTLDAYLDRLLVSLESVQSGFVKSSVSSSD